MTIIDLFSKRQRREQYEIPDIYVYDKLPHPLRVQIVHIIQDVLEPKNSFYPHNISKVYQFMNQALCREYGVFRLIEYANSDQESVINFFLSEKSTERSLDVVELWFKIIKNSADWIINPDTAIAELNERFKEHGIGFQFESNQLIRMDSTFLHSEAVKPTLRVLQGDKFNGANEEFLLAHENYRHGRYKDCLVYSLKAFESTMKVICDIHGWTIQPSDTAAKLIGTCFEQGLLPSYLELQMGSLKSLLVSGVPTLRNKLGGHGQGTEIIVVEEYFARYVLNLTATSILFLVEASSAKV